jgi:thioredoxin-related protein
MKLILIALITLQALSFKSFSQELKKSSGLVNWLDFEDAVARNSQSPKKIFLDMYTNWCGWCKRMDATTFSDSTVANYMNRHFYSVKFNAERKDSIFFKDRYFPFKPEYKTNELAAILMNGKMSYPTTVFLDSNSNLIGPVPGYLSPGQLLPVLRYFAEDIYLKTSWDDYMNEHFR